MTHKKVLAKSLRRRISVTESLSSLTGSVILRWSFPMRDKSEILFRFILNNCIARRRFSPAAVFVRSWSQKYGRVSQVNVQIKRNVTFIKQLSAISKWIFHWCLNRTGFRRVYVNVIIPMKIALNIIVEVSRSRLCDGCI